MKNISLVKTPDGASTQNVARLSDEAQVVANKYVAQHAIVQKRWRSVALATLFLVGAATFFYWQNNAIDVERFVCESAQLPNSFDGFKIVQISDLHNKEFGRANGRLLAKIRAAEPNLIAITGDLTNDPDLDVEFSATFVEKAREIAPVFYVSGNHEAAAPKKFASLIQALERSGATVLDGEFVALERGADSIVLAGVGDPFLEAKLQRRAEAAVVDEKLKKLAIQRERYYILLSHRPELVGVYANNGVDVALTGHAHGGQIRVPLIGGLFAPNQGFFPTYSSGAYRVGQTTELVSRGLGPSAFPTRIFNRPNIVVCELKNCD